MIDFDADRIRDLVATYINDDRIEGRDPKVLDDLSYMYDKLMEIEREEFYNGEVTKVLNSFQLAKISEENCNRAKAIRGVKSADIAFIAANYGFMFGMAYAEQRRLGFEA